MTSKIDKFDKDGKFFHLSNQRRLEDRAHVIDYGCNVTLTRKECNLSFICVYRRTKKELSSCVDAAGG